MLNMFKSYLRSFNPRTQLSIFLFIWAAFFILTSLLQSTILQQYGDPSDFKGTISYLIEHKPSVVKALNAMHSILIFLLPAFLFAYWRQPNPFDYLKLNTKQSPKVWALSILLGMLLIPTLVSLSAIIKDIQLFGALGQDMQASRDQNLQLYMTEKTLMGLLSNLLLLGLLPAICEEFLFRGVLQRLISENFNHKIWAIILPSLAFALLHFSLYEFIPILLGGLFLSLIYHYSQSLKLCILIHFINNGVQVILISVAGGEAVSLNVWIYTLVLLLSLGVMAIVWWKWKEGLKPQQIS